MAVSVLNLLLLMPSFYLLSQLVDCCLLIFKIFQTGTMTDCAAKAATIPPLLCHNAVTIACLLVLLLLGRKYSSDTITSWMAQAAAMLPPL